MAGDLDNQAANAARAKFGIPPLQDTRQELWPENAPVTDVFLAMSTQWNASYGGYVGLKYEALPIVFELLEIGQQARAEILSLLRIMEIEALTVINKRRD